MSHDTKRRIGSTDVEVSRLGFGGTALAGHAAPKSEAEAEGVLAAALVAGITYFDTSPFYGHGLSEHRIGAGLRQAERDRITLSTKVGRLLIPDASSATTGVLPFRTRFDYSRTGVLRSFENSLQRLGTDRIDLLIIHDVSHRWHGDRFDQRLREAMEGALPALAELRAEGVVGAIGLGTNDLDAAVPMTETGMLDCVMIAREYNLLNHASLLDRLAPAISWANASLIVAAPYASGILATGLTDGATYMYERPDAGIRQRMTKIEAVCAALGVPLRAAALQFAAMHPLIASVATGMRSQAEIDDAVAAFRHPIPPTFWHRLMEHGLIDPRAVALDPVA